MTILGFLEDLVLMLASVFIWASLSGATGLFFAKITHHKTVGWLIVEVALIFGVLYLLLESMKYGSMSSLQSAIQLILLVVVASAVFIEVGFSILDWKIISPREAWEEVTHAPDW